VAPSEPGCFSFEEDRRDEAGVAAAVPDVAAEDDIGRVLLLDWLTARVPATATAASFGAVTRLVFVRSSDG
jgi:hypothetical protein